MQFRVSATENRFYEVVCIEANSEEEAKDIYNEKLKNGKIKVVTENIEIDYCELI